MPAILKIVPRRGKESWDSLDPDNSKQVVRAVMIEYDRTELDHVHYTAATSINTPPKVFSGIKTSYPCFRNCQIFLLCGAFFIEGQGRLADTSCSYLVKDEESIGFCGSKTVIVILEEGEQRGVCRRHTQEWQEKLRAKESKSKSSIECSIM